MHLEGIDRELVPGGDEDHGRHPPTPTVPITSKPSISGICTSSSTRSGSSSAMAWAAERPSPHSPDHRKPGTSREQRHDAGARHRFVIDHEHPDRGGHVARAPAAPSRRGRRTVAFTPPPGTLARVSRHAAP